MPTEVLRVLDRTAFREELERAGGFELVRREFDIAQLPAAFENSHQRLERIAFTQRPTKVVQR